MEAHHYDALVRAQVAGRKVILTSGPLVAFGDEYIQHLQELGAQGVFIIADGVGTGVPPSPHLARWEILETNAESINDGIRRFRRRVERPGSRLRARIDEWDPDRTAIVLGGPFYTRRSLAGRPVYGGRQKRWESLEDKVVVDQFWDAAGVERMPSTVVTAEASELTKAAAALDRGEGTVWAGDSREGFNGGAEYARWIRRQSDSDEALAFFSAHCDRVRVMPFLAGIPCSIHGIVFPDATIALRPCELVTLRRSDSRFQYAGFSIYWDPPAPDRDFMRQVAHRTGEELRRRVRYRGAFTIDGVLTAEGFRPTELNTRSGAAMSLITAAAPHLPVGSIQRGLVAGESYDYRPMELEAALVEAADTKRSARVQTVVSRRVATTETIAVCGRSGSLSVCQPTEENRVATLALGPSSAGGFLGITLDRPVQNGESVAPLAAELLSVADRHWQLGIGPLTPARPVKV